MLAIMYLLAKRRRENAQEESENRISSKAGSANRADPTFFATRPIQTLPPVNTATNTWAIPNREF